MALIVWGLAQKVIEDGSVMIIVKKSEEISTEAYLSKYVVMSLKKQN